MYTPTEASMDAALTTDSTTVVVQRQEEGVVISVKGKPHAHGNYKAGHTRK